MKKTNHTPLAQYLLFFTVVIGFLVLVICVYVNSIIKSTVRDNIVEANVSRLGVLRIQNEEKLSMMLDVSNQISLSPDIKPFRYKESPMDAFFLKQKLAAYDSTLKVCDQMFVIFDKDDYLYSMFTSVSFSLFVENMLLLENISPGELAQFIRNPDNRILLLPSQKTESIFTKNADMALLNVPMLQNGRTRIGSILFLIHDDLFQQLFVDTKYETRNMYIMYGDQIVSAARRIDGVDDTAVIDVVNNAQSSVQTVLINNIPYLLFVQHGRLLGLKYVSLVPEKVVHIQANRSFFAFNVSLFVILIPFLICGISAARRIARQTYETQAFAGALASAVYWKIKGRNRLRLIKNGNSKNNLYIDLWVDDNLIAQMSDFVKRFIKCQFMSMEDAVDDAMETLGVNVMRPYFAISIISSRSFKEWCNTQFKSNDVYEHITALWMELIEQDKYAFLIFADSQQVLQQWISKMHVSFLDMDKDTVVSVSDIHTNSLEAGLAYLEASAAYDNRFVMGTDALLKFSDVNMTASDLNEITKSFVDSFYASLLSGDKKLVHARIDELIRVLEKRQPSLFTFRVIYNDIISALLNRYINCDGGNEYLHYYNVFHLLNCRKISDLELILRDMCEKILEKTDKFKEEEPEPMVMVSEYLMRHFDDPNLNISVVAEKFGYTATYLSQEYKRVIGLNPSDHLTQLRMEKAKELLLETDMPIESISEAVGYYNVTSFIRRFKKEMSTTPAQYRRTYCGSREKLCSARTYSR